MATRVLLLVMMTGLFAALWSNDHSGRPASFARRPVEQVVPEEEPASIAKPVAPPAEPEDEAETGEAAAQVNCSHHSLANVAAGTICGMPLCRQDDLLLLSLPAAAEVSSAAVSRDLPLQGSELDAELFADALPPTASTQEVSAEDAGTDPNADLFTDCELPLPEVLAAGEYRIVNGNGLVLSRTFSREDLTWLGTTCDGGAEVCQQVEVDGVCWYFIRVNVEETQQAGQPVLTDSADESSAENAAAEEVTAAGTEAADLAAAEVDDTAAEEADAGMAVERARAQWLLTGWQLGCQVDWMLRRIGGVTRGPGQMLWSAGVRLQQQLADRQSAGEGRLSVSPRVEETR